MNADHTGGDALGRSDAETLGLDAQAAGPRAAGVAVRGVRMLAPGVGAWSRTA